MALWFMQLRTFLRIVLALLSMVGPLLGLGVAYIMLRDWIQVPQGEVYYVEHDYLGDAAWWGLLSLGTLLAAGRVLSYVTRASDGYGSPSRCRSS